MGTYTKDNDLVLLLVLSSIETILFVIALLLLVICVPAGLAVMGGVVLGAVVLCIYVRAYVRDISADDEKSDNTEDKGSADEKPEEYREDETDLSESLFPDLKEHDIIDYE